MDLNFEITQIDIYETVKEQLLPLARKYKLKLPPHESLITVVTLRRALALTKAIFKRAQIDRKFLQVLGELFINNELSELHATEYPQLTEYKNLLENFYDNPEDISFVGDSTDYSPDNTQDSDDLNKSEVASGLDSALKVANDIKSVKEQISVLKQQLKSEEDTNLVETSADKPSSAAYANDLIIAHETLLTGRKIFTTDVNTQSSSLSSGNLDYEEIPDLPSTKLGPPLVTKTHTLVPRIQSLPLPDLPRPELNQGILAPQQPQNNLQVQNRRIMAEENTTFIKPTIYSGEKYDNVHEFLYRYDMAAEANCWTDVTRKRFFPCYLTSYAQKRYTNFARDNPDADFETLKREIKREFSSDSYTEELKITLENRLQGNDESPTQYLCVMTDVSL